MEKKIRVRQDMCLMRKEHLSKTGFDSKTCSSTVIEMQKHHCWSSSMLYLSGEASVLCAGSSLQRAGKGNLETPIHQSVGGAVLWRAILACRKMQSTKAAGYGRGAD